MLKGNRAGPVKERVLISGVQGLPNQHILLFESKRQMEMFSSSEFYGSLHICNLYAQRHKPTDSGTMDADDEKVVSNIKPTPCSQVAEHRSKDCTNRAYFSVAFLSA